MNLDVAHYYAEKWSREESFTGPRYVVWAQDYLQWDAVDEQTKQRRYPDIAERDVIAVYENGERLSR